jgi:hypothetical protein
MKFHRAFKKVWFVAWDEIFTRKSYRAIALARSVDKLVSLLCDRYFLLL